MKIIQITDTHLVPSGIVVNAVDPEEKLRAAISDIVEKHSDADLLTITGDLGNNGDPEAYALLKEILVPVKCKIRLLLGNHDDRSNFVAAFPEQLQDENGFIQSFIDTRFGRLLFLDSHEMGVIGGIYGADRLEFLEKALTDAGELPVTVFIHHPPFDVGIAHFDKIGMHDNGAVLARLNAHAPGVRHIVFGHIHVLLAGTTASGIAYSSGQACAHRFITDIDTPQPWWTDGNPCYRIISLDETGLRAYSVEVGQKPTTQAPICAGP